eukprot:15352423-Ditylum_brightwellii.AAC.1
MASNYVGALDNDGDTATGEPAGTSRLKTNVVISIFYYVVIQIHPNHSFWDMYVNFPPVMCTPPEKDRLQ